MEIRKTLTVVLAGLLGLTAGTAIRRLSPQSSELRSPEPTVVAAAEKLESTDTLENLLKLEGFQFHDHAALWMLDAKPADLAAFWTACKARPDTASWLLYFLFSRWIILDPDAAEKAAGEEGIGSLRWAQAIKEPDAIVKRVDGMPAGETAAALRALAEFHPETAIKLLVANPALGIPEVLGRIAGRLAVDDPKGALNFARLYQIGHLPSVMRAWSRVNPQAALEWLKSQPAESLNDPPLDDFIAALVEENPKLLAEIAGRQPVGRIRREIERAVFLKSIETDPSAGLIVARANQSPRIAGEWFAEIGRRQLAAQPDQAWATFEGLLEKCPDAFRMYDNLSTPNSATWEKVELRGLKEFTRSLLDVDPARTLDTALAAQMKRPEGQPDPWVGALSTLADDWITRDLGSFVKWLESQPEGPVRDGGAGLVAWTHAARQNFPEAMRWAANIRDPEHRLSRMEETAGRWARFDKNASNEWSRSAGLPDEVRGKLMETLEEDR